MANWYKDPADIRRWFFEWALWLPAGVTITAATVVSVDGNVTFTGDPDIQGSRVYIVTSGGSLPLRYSVLKHTVTLSNGEVWAVEKAIIFRTRVA